MTTELRPATASERNEAIDAVRGVALFGVLIVNLLSSFRVPLLKMEHSPSDPVSLLVSIVFEFRAIALFSLLFGIGTAIQTERGAFRPRRFLYLILIGFAHVTLIWNGDILMAYGVCGLLLLPFLASKRVALTAGSGLFLIALPHIVDLPFPFPSPDAFRVGAIEATRVYEQGSFMEVWVFRCHEWVRFVIPLLLSTLPRTLGLMLLGIAIWRSGALQNRKLLKWTFISCGILGILLNTAARAPGAGGAGTGLWRRASITRT